MHYYVSYLVLLMSIYPLYGAVHLASALMFPLVSVEFLSVAFLSVAFRVPFCFFSPFT